MLAVIRHGDRTPKQKMKMKVTQVGGLQAIERLPKAHLPCFKVLCAWLLPEVVGLKHKRESSREQQTPPWATGPRLWLIAYGCQRCATLTIGKAALEEALTER